MKKEEKDKKKYSLRIRMLEINVGIALVSFLEYCLYALSVG